MAGTHIPTVLLSQAIVINMRVDGNGLGTNTDTVLLVVPTVSAGQR